MGFLKEWVRELVVLVLLGSCLELIIPSSSFKKYIRMAMGLIVVLAVVRPIASFLGSPVMVETVALDQSRPDGRLPTLNEIMTKAGEFRAKNRTLATDEARGQIAAHAREAALGVSGVRDATVAVNLADGPGDPRIVGVTVTLVPGSRYGPVRQVEPVQPVHPGGGARAGPVTVPAQDDLAGAVRREVAARLGINADPKLVRVLVQQPEIAGREGQ